MPFKWMKNITCARHMTFKAKNPKIPFSYRMKGVPSASLMLEILGGGRWLATIGQLVCGGFRFLVAVSKFCADFWSASVALWWRPEVSFPVNPCFFFYYFFFFSNLSGSSFGSYYPKWHNVRSWTNNHSRGRHQDHHMLLRMLHT
jgi:hypothetical protein